MRSFKVVFIFAAIALLAVLPACTRAATSQDTSSATMDAMYTAQAQTVEALATQGMVVNTPEVQPLLPEASPTAELATEAAAEAVTDTPVPPTATQGVSLPTPTTGAAAQQQAVVPTGLCDAVGFVADVSVPDGSLYAPNTAFTKTWRLKNVGTCTWTTSYSLVFASGEKMGGAASTKLAASVAPGGTVDLSVNLTAPAANGSYQGFWALQNASGKQFGLGSSANVPFWVKITVGTPSTPSTPGTPSAGGFDFVAKADTAKWTSQSGALTFGGVAGDAKGFASKVDNAQLENGASSGKAGLLVGPNNTLPGFVQGEYGDYTVQAGDRFKATINCAYNASGCNGYFRLDYIEGGVQKTYWSFRERYEGLFYNADVNLSGLAGKTVKFVLAFYNDGVYSANDKALWVAPRIEGSGGVVVTPANTPVPGACTDKVAFIADVTVPDNSQYAANATFTKTWRLKNTGTCTWTTDYALAFVSGEQMGGTSPNKLTKSVAPGQTTDISVELKAPAADGTYKGNWALKNDKGVQFALGAASNVPFWVQIKVGSGSVTPTVTPTPVPGACTNLAAFVADVTVPDNTLYAPNATFTKTWRIKNVGTCTWSTDYASTYVSGEQMGGTSPNKLTKSVTPGQTIDISVDMKAPAAAGTYKGNWALKSASGTIFGLGADGSISFWVQIKVGEGSSSTPTNTPVPGACVNKAAFIADVTVPDDTVFAPNTAFKKTWRLKNIGTCTWNTDYFLVFVGGEKMGGANEIQFSKNIAPGQTVDVSVDLTAPAAAGTYKGDWGLRSVGGQVFGLGTTAGTPFYVQIKVQAAATPAVTPTATNTPTVTPTP